MEVLVVVTLLASVAAIGIVSLAAADELARLHSAAALVRDLDARARLTARRGTPVELRADPRTGEWLVVAAPSGDVVSRTSLGGIVARWSAPDGAPLDAIRFDRCGNSPDYIVHLSTTDRAKTWQVCGLTGWFDPGEKPR